MLLSDPFTVRGRICSQNNDSVCIWCKRVACVCGIIHCWVNDRATLKWNRDQWWGRDCCRVLWGSGSTKIGNGKIDGGEKTYPAPKRFSVGKMEASQMTMDIDTDQIPTLSVSSSKQIYSALRNDKSDISLLSSEPTATSDVTTSEHAGKKQSTGKDRQPLQEKQLRSQTLPFFMACKAQWTRSLIFSRNPSHSLSTHNLLYKAMHYTSSKHMKIISALTRGPKWCDFSWRTTLHLKYM